MATSNLVRYSSFRLYIAPALTFILLLCVIIKVSPGFAQTSPCTTPPTGTNYPIFRKGDTVYSIYDSNITSDQVRQIQVATNAWSEANSRNGSEVYFGPSGPFPETSPNTVTVLHWQNARIVDPNGNPDKETKAQFVVNETWSDGTVKDATIYFNLNATVSPTNNSPYYDPNITGFDTVFIKKALHEIGHGMDLNDMPESQQQPGQSVMNTTRDDCPNDKCGSVVENEQKVSDR